MPPWPMPWPLTISASRTSDRVAVPGPTASSDIPSRWLARSSAHIVSALRLAVSSGVTRPTLASGLLGPVGRRVQEEVAHLGEPLAHAALDLVGGELDLLRGQMVREVHPRRHQHLVGG